MLHAQLGVSTMEEISMTDVMGDNEAQLTNLMELLPDRIDAKKQSLHPWPYKKNAHFKDILKKDPKLIRVEFSTLQDPCKC